MIAHLGEALVVTDDDGRTIDPIPATARDADDAEQGMQRSKRTSTTHSLIAVLALGLTCSTSAPAESWFGWHKPQKTADAKPAPPIASSPRPSATKPSTRSEATKPTLGNRRQTAPTNPAPMEEAAPAHWWSRLGGKPEKDDSKAITREKKATEEKVPVVVKKSLPPPPSKSQIASRKGAKSDSPAGKARVGDAPTDEHDDRAFVTLDPIEPVTRTAPAAVTRPSPNASATVAAKTVRTKTTVSQNQIARTEQQPNLQPTLDESPRGRSVPGIRHVGFDEPAAETPLAPLVPLLREGATKSQALLPFAEPERTPKIQLRPSQKSDEMISLTVRDAPLSVVLSLIAEQHGLNLVAGGEVEGRVTVTLNDVALDEALDALLTVNGYSWHRNKNILVVSKIAAESRSSPQLRGVVLRVFRLNYISADDVDKVVQSLLSPAGHAVTTVIDSKNTRRTREEIVVEDLPEYVARIESYITEVDRPPRQVLIEAHVLQISLKSDCLHGVNLKEIFDINGTKITLETKGLAKPAANPAFFFGIDSANFHALLEALKVSTDSKTLATPQVLCLNGQHAKIQIGQQLGFLVTTTTQTSTLQNVNFLDVGVVLDVTPTITEEGLVMMQVKPEVSGGQINAAGLPQEDTTEVETTVMLADGHGMIIGGLIKEEDTEVQTKIPYLGDLWLVGRLFQRRSVIRTRNEVIIALVPYIVPHPDDKPAGMDAGLERVQSRLLGPPLERLDRRHWEPDLPDAIRNPKHLFSGEVRRRIEDPYGNGLPETVIEE